MIRIIINIFLSISLLFSIDVADDLAFLSIPGSAHLNSLGNSITASSGLPTALLLSPANIWDDSKYSLTTTTRSHSVIGVNYYNTFFSWKPKIFTKIVDRTGIGIVRYGVNSIEEYDDHAIFQNYFSYNSYAFLYGIAKRTLGVDIGLGLKYINKSFSIDDYSRNYYGMSFGVTVQNTLSTIINSPFPYDFSISFALNKIVPLSNENSSMTKVTLGCSKMIIENYKFQLINSDIKIKFHSDISKFNYSSFLRSRTAVEIKFKYSEIIRISTNVGYNGLIKSVDNLEINEIKQFDDKWTTGIFIDLFSNRIFSKSSKNLVLNLGRSWEFNNSESIVESGFWSLNFKWFDN